LCGNQQAFFNHHPPPPPSPQRVWLAPDFCGAPAILKQRFSKRYRHPDLDTALTTARVRGEARALLRARRLGVRAPALLFVDAEASTLYLERVEGVTLKEVLRGGVPPERAAALAAAVGRAVAALHDGGLVHGDLTTSNLIVPANDACAVVVIDFGLAAHTTLAEDRAVDLYVLERALAAAHAGDGAADALFDAVKAAYRHHARCWCAVLNKFAEVRLRGRKRSMVG
jgi:TP53 regulating kinase-like protein